MYDIPTHLGGCVMEEFAITEFNPHDFNCFIDSFTASFSCLTNLLDKVGTTDGKQGLPSCDLIHVTYHHIAMMPA